MVSSGSFWRRGEIDPRYHAVYAVRVACGEAELATIIRALEAGSAP